MKTVLRYAGGEKGLHDDIFPIPPVVKPSTNDMPAPGRKASTSPKMLLTNTLPVSQIRDFARAPDFNEAQFCILTRAAQILAIRTELQKIGLEEYSTRFVEYGFETWSQLAGITEAEMATLSMKLGHRRKLQREIAARRGHPWDEPLDSASVVCCSHASRENMNLKRKRG